MTFQVNSEGIITNVMRRQETGEWIYSDRSIWGTPVIMDPSKIWCHPTASYCIDPTHPKQIRGADLLRETAKNMLEGVDQKAIAQIQRNNQIDTAIMIGAVIVVLGIIFF